MFFRNRFEQFLKIGFFSLTLSVISSFLYVLPSYAAFSLDSTFGSGGKVITSFGSEGYAIDVALQSDGKAVAVGANSNGGHQNWAIARYNTDGSLDTSFGTNGTVTQDFGYDNVARGVIIQSDGKIVVAGSGQNENEPRIWTIGRYNSNGSLDTSFGGSGIIATPLGDDLFETLNALELQPDGKIIAAGYLRKNGAVTEYVTLVRYNSDGSYDQTFGNGGLEIYHSQVGTFQRVQAAALQSDGKIVIFGDSSGTAYLVRFNIDGSVDTNFGSNGTVIENQLGSAGSNSVVIQSDGKIVVTGDYSGTPNPFVIRHNQDGSLDTSFGSGGYVLGLGTNITYPRALVLTDGKIVIGGSDQNQYDAALARLNADGTLDTSFGTNGFITTHLGTGNNNGFTSLVLQTDGKILGAGFGSNGSYDDWALARYVDNAPTINQISNVTINEGDTYSANGSFTDTNPNATSWTATVDYGDGGGAQSLALSGMNFSLSHVYKDNGTYTVTVSVTDNQGLTGTGTATITVNNVNPTVGAITAPSSPVLVNTAITASANFTDPGVLDTHTASWNWGDGNTTTGTVTESNGSGSVSNSHTYTSTGVYTITLTVTDKDGGAGTSTYQYVAVYDSSTSFAGGRSFDNPSSASPNTSGKVSFGVSAKYTNSNTLTGNAKMDFKAANLDFASTSLSSLATSNGRAYLKGNGTVNGSGNYTFLATGIDGSVVGGNDLIRFQIKDSSNNVIYDSQPGASDTTDPTTVDATGNIRVH